jgi:hypothetical protein|tara:strand:- start:1727 stop:1951 length:225 start_codon:yes stop_codon:yes gene_type:complete
MSDLSRSEIPHSAIVKVSIKVHKQLKDGSLEPSYLPVEELNRLGIAPFAEMRIDGFDKNSCVKNVLDKLEKLNG